MLNTRPRLWGALLVGAALALPLALSAQTQPANTAPAASTASPAPPVTAPTGRANSDTKPGTPQVTADAPKVGSPPTPQAGSTAVPGWNNPPSWGAGSERPGSVSAARRRYREAHPGRRTDGAHSATARSPNTAAGSWVACSRDHRFYL